MTLEKKQSFLTTLHNNLSLATSSLNLAKALVNDYCATIDAADRKLDCSKYIDDPVDVPDGCIDIHYLLMDLYMLTVKLDSYCLALLDKRGNKQCPDS